MAIDLIQLPVDGTGKKIAARSYTESAQTVYAQAGYLTTDTASGNPAAVQNSSPSTEYGLVVRNIPSGTQAVSGTVAVTESGTWTVQPGNTANTTAWLVTGTGGTFPATQSGTWTVGLTNDPTVVDNAGFTDGTTKLDMGGYIFDEVAGTALTENDAAAGRIDSKRAIVHVLEDATTRGQRASVSSGGALKVDATATIQPVSGTFWQATQPVSGTLAVTESGTWTVQPGNTANSTAWLVTGTGGTFPATQSGTWTVGLTNDPTIADNAAFTDGTTRVEMAGYILDETPGTSLTENDAGAARMDSKRAQVLVIEDATTRGQRASVSALGALGIQGTQTAVATTNWTSATTLNTANSISVADMNTVTVAMSNTSTMTNGVLTFEVSPDGGTTWFPIQMARIDSYTVETTYTLNTVAVRAWSTSVDGFTNFRVRLSTVITGSGTASVFITAQTFAIEPVVSVGQATASLLNATVTATNLSTNTTQINSVTPLMGNGVTGTGSQRVTIASDNTAFSVNAVQSGTWTVQPGNTPNTSAWLTNPRPATAGGHSIQKILAAATTNAANIKSSAGQVYGWYLFNNAAYTCFVKIFNTSGSPTMGTTSPVYQIALPAGSAANVFTPFGIAHATGIGIGITKGIADLDATAVAASDVAGAIFYT